MDGFNVMYTNLNPSPDTYVGYKSKSSITDSYRQVEMNYHAIQNQDFHVEYTGGIESTCLFFK